MLFHSTPPLNIANDRPAPLAHSTEYLAAKVERQAQIEEERKRAIDIQSADEEGKPFQHLEQADRKPVKQETPDIKQEEQEEQRPLGGMQRDYLLRLQREAEILNAFVAGHKKAKKEVEVKEETEEQKFEPFDPKSLPPRPRYFPVRDHWYYLTETKKRN